ncbi:peptidyl-prolyl cis-trans isomerase [Flavobacteriaceae bacterium]|nr:peptidyl-prolyl cis-trans isomerase [Flavobacteriaceae bacterium]
MKYLNTFLIITFIVLTTCDFPKVKDNIQPLARANDVLLLKDDIDFSFIDGATKSDSIIFVQNVINDWATNQLLIDGAIQNLNDETQFEFEQLVQQYKIDLYSSAYLEALVGNNLDSLVSYEELQDVYLLNKELFTLKEDLLKLRYININTSLSNLNEVKKMFKRFNSDDRSELDSISIQFNSFYFRDTIWIKKEDVISKIKPLELGFNKVLLKKSNFIEIKDSLGLYLIKINEVLQRGKPAPVEYVSPTIKQIVINNRKLNLIRKLKSDIVNDAIKNKKFETFK